MTELVASENDYEDLLGQWSDLESGLGIILSSPANSREFLHRVVQYDRWMQGLMTRDPDVGLYLLFQLASNSPVGYSASHALVCATLCHLVAQELGLGGRQRDALVYAALTMNIAMTDLQDALANQAEKPSPPQQEVIHTHALRGHELLSGLGVSDPLWLAAVSCHHDDLPAKAQHTEDAVRLSAILKVVDRYAAMISPRMSRAGRTATESARAVMASASAKSDEVAHAMVRTVGLCPPGTFVRMESGELAVVLRRSSVANQPYVAVVGGADGALLRTPRLHRTASGESLIRTALAAAAVQTNLNHFHILRLAAQAD
ncbi:MAG: phosphodiesterase [Burkholderiales bacterium PBB3]|nr:MAG: phosphodiesterase [Burkholderiales bacterium PBB3]